MNFGFHSNKYSKNSRLFAEFGGVKTADNRIQWIIRKMAVNGKKKKNKKILLTNQSFL